MAPTATAGPAAGFAPHVDAGVSPFAALAPTPARASSLTGTLAADLAAFAARSGNGAWPNLPRALVAARLQELVSDPTRLNQAGLNACGPAAALYLFAKRRIDRFAQFAITLYDSGAADFGTVRVSGDGLFGKDPAKMSWPPGNIPQALDWMLLSSTLRSMGTLMSFGGEPSDAASGITLPGEMETWLRDGVGYSTVTNEANKFFTRDLGHLGRLSPDATLDVVVLVNVGVVEARAGSKGVAGAVVDWVSESVLNQFPNHWFVLERPVVDDGTKIDATSWTWGRSGYVFSGLHAGWKAGYYGAVKARL